MNKVFFENHVRRDLKLILLFKLYIKILLFINRSDENLLLKLML